MLSPAKRFGKLRLFAVPLLAASALALFAACGGNPDMISRQEAEQIALEQMPQAELSELDLTTDKGNRRGNRPCAQHGRGRRGKRG